MTFRTFLCACLLACGLASPGSSETQVVASTQGPKIVALNPLRNGLSAITFTWALSEYSHNRVTALRAALSTVVNSGTPTLSAFEADTFREVNGIDLSISVEPDDILLTMTAPHDVFEKALDHLNKLFQSSSFSQQWYERDLLQAQPVRAARRRRPDHLMSVLADYLRFPVADDGVDTRMLDFRFGMPRQIILRAQGDELQPLFDRAAEALPLRKLPPLARNKPAADGRLPNGVIFVPDPDSSETLIFLVNAQNFDTPSDRIATNLLMDYMGAHQGSEMFSVIRQEKRAAYDPRTDFRHLGQNRALLSLSATVATENWPAILGTIHDIYAQTRDGDVSKTGLANTKRRLLNGYEYKFVTNPTWGARHYLAEYPNGSTGNIYLPLFQSLVKADLIYLRGATKRHLPPIEDYLLILIGGTLPPPDAMRATGYCELPLSAPLRHCLDELAKP